jgi:hypothetical protein
MTTSEITRRIEELFPRYWDQTLNEGNWQELELLLDVYPEARATFQTLSLQAAAVAELAVPTLPVPHWSRRRVLTYAGASLAASIAAGVSFLRSRNTPPSDAIELVSIVGNVEPLHRPGSRLQVGSSVEAGITLRTLGDRSSAVLKFGQRGLLTLTGNTSIQITSANSLRLDEGTIAGEFSAAPPGQAAMLLGTLAAVLTIRDATNVVVNRHIGITDIGVQSGHMEVVSTCTTISKDVQTGERITVQDDGKQTVEKLRASPNSYAWNLQEPLPKGWAVGTRESFAGRSCVQTVAWPDPFHNKRMMYEIRSHQDWIRGFFQVYPESQIQLTYWVDEVPNAMQLVIVSRTSRSSRPECGCLDLQRVFVDSPTKQWVTITARADEMLDSDCPVTFGPPWIGFSVILNTYEQDCGLRVADFRVSRPGFPADE